MKSQCVTINSELESHMIFICPECGINHETQKSWRQHLNNEHGYSIKSPMDFDFIELNNGVHYECRICKARVTKGPNLLTAIQFHRFSHLKFSIIYRCRHCTQSFARKRVLSDHLYRLHDDALRSLQSLSPKKTIAKYRNASNNSEFYLRFLCPQCGMMLETNDQWMDHINRFHKSTSVDLKVQHIKGTKSFYCVECKRVINTVEYAGLQRHRFIHLPYPLYIQCAFCMVRKDSKVEILHHFIQAHPTKFNSVQDLIKEPQEFGCHVPDLEIVREVRRLLRRPILNSMKNCRKRDTVESTTSLDVSKNDLLKKAILTSCLNFEDNSNSDDDDAQSTVKSLTMNLSSFSSRDSSPTKSLSCKIFDSSLKSTDNDEKLTGKNKIEKPNVEVDDEPSSSTMLENFEITQLRKTRNILKCDSVEPQSKRLKLSAEESLIDKEKNNPPPIQPNDTWIMEKFVKFLCPECGKNYEDQLSWRKHVYTNHPNIVTVEKNFKLLKNETYFCVDCLKIFQINEYADLQRHTFTHMPYQAYLKCEFCEQTKTAKPKILEHIKTAHKNQLENHLKMKPFNGLFIKCENCIREFTKELRLEEHRKICDGQQFIPAPQTYNIADNLKLIEHLKLARNRIQRIAKSLNLN